MNFKLLCRFFVMSSCLLFYSQNAFADCSEFDDGIAAEKPGYVIVNGKYIFDSCGPIGTPEHNILTEWHCDGSIAKYAEIDCMAEYNKACFDMGQSASCGGEFFSDWDNDGVINKIDNCANIPNVDQTDSDLDNKGDACDSPAVTLCDDLDYDGDKFTDKCDNCPTVANSDQKDSNDNGVGDVCETQCDHNDYEDNPYEAGSKDTCVAAVTMLQEVICKNGKSEIATIDCNTLGEMVCEGGKCVKPEEPIEEPPPKEEPEETKKNESAPDSDGDGDGIPYKDDNCKSKTNADQKDEDNDGIGDVCIPAFTDGEDGNGGGGGGGGGDCDKKDDTKHLASLSTLNLYAVAGGGGWRWAGGEGGNVVRRFGNQLWQKLPNPWDSTNVKPSTDAKRTITSMWSPDGTVLYAATVAGYLFELTEKTWVQWGPTGKNDGKDFGGAIYSVHGTSKGDFWLAGYDGIIWHYSRGVWKNEKIITSSVPTAVSQKKSTKYDKSIWRSIFAVQDGPTWVVGDDGAIAKKSKANQKLPAGTGWETTKLASSTDLRAVMAGAKKAWIGGVKSGILCSEDNSLQFSDCGGKIGAITVLGIFSNGANIIAVGTESKIAIKEGNSWQLKIVPLPNTLTSIWSDGTTTLVTGLNGVIYELEEVIEPKYLMKKDIAHPEWTDTKWTAHAGGLEDFWVAGDDLAIASRYDDAWQLFYSDDSVVPFTYGSGIAFLSGGAPAQRTWADIYIDKNDNVYTAGNADFVIKRSNSGAIEKIMLPNKGGKIPDMRTIRKSPFETVLAAGNLGLFSLGEVLGELFLDPPSSAVADKLKDEIWLADKTGAYIKSGDDPWKDFPWGDVKITPVDISSVRSKVVVVGDKVTESSLSASTLSLYSKIKNYIFGAEAESKSYYLASSNGGAWEGVPSPAPDSRILGIHPVDEKIEACIDYVVGEYCIGPEIYRGMVAMGENGLVAGRWQGMWIPIDTESNEDWYDGTYDFDWNVADWWLDGADFEGIYWYEFYVLGVGSHNDISKTWVYKSCKID